MKAYIKVETATGRIIENGAAQEGAFPGLLNVVTRPGEAVYPNPTGAVSGRHWWNGSEPVEMQRLSDVITFDQATMTFSNVPDGTEVIVYGKGRGSAVVNDGFLRYDTDIAGEHLFSFDHPQYASWVDFRVEIA